MIAMGVAASTVSEREEVRDGHLKQDVVSAAMGS